MASPPSVPLVVTAVPVPGVTAAERLAVAQARVDALDLILEEKLETLGAPGIVRPKDALLFVKDLEYKEGSKSVQQLTCKCMFCNMHISSTGATRVVDHLTACVLCPQRIKVPLRNVRACTSGKRKHKQEQLKLVSDQADKALNDAKLAKMLRQPNIGLSLNAAESEVADHAIARFFYANGLSFAAADSQPGSYYRSMVEAIKATISGYIPPNYNKIAGSLLDDCHTHMETDIAKRDSAGQLSERFGIT